MRKCVWCDDENVPMVKSEFGWLCKECYKGVHICNDCGARKHVDDLTIVSDEYYCADCVDKAQFDYYRACVERSNHEASTNAWLDSERGAR